MAETTSLDTIADEFIARHRNGEQPSVDEYAVRHPDLAEDIRDLFPTALMMEKAKARLQFGRKTANGGIAFGSSVVKQLGDYQLLREIGRGGMGIVYEAEQSSLGRRVAVKVLRSSALLDSMQAKRFQREAQAAAALHHTNIVPIFGVGEQDGIHYYVMQLIDGDGLDQLLSDVNFDSTGKTERLTERLTDRNLTDETVDYLPVHRGATSSADDSEDTFAESQDEPRPSPRSSILRDEAFDREHWNDIAKIGYEVADALHYAHEKGVLHRDIKPGNLILDSRNSVWIADFGLAKLQEGDDVTRSGDIVGTLRYMSPEQFGGTADRRSDVYSLGLTLYELATWRPAFDQSDRAKLLQQMLHDVPPHPRQINPQIPRDLETIILKAIAPDPAHRYETAGELADDLDQFREDKPIRARRVGVAEQIWRWCRRNPAAAVPSLTAAMLLALVALVASIGYFQTKAALIGQAEEHENARVARDDAEAKSVEAQAERERAEKNYQTAVRQKQLAESNLQKAEREQQRAESNLSLSLSALEEIFERVAPSRLPQSQDDPMSGEPFEPDAFPVVSAEDVALLKRILEFYDKFAEQNKTSPTLQHQAAKSHRRVGDIHQRLGQFDEALQAYLRALAINEQLADEAPLEHPDWTINAAIHNEIGLMLEMTGNYNDARDHHREALEILRQQLALVPNSTDVNLELVRTRNLLGYAIWGTSRRQVDSDTPELVTQAEDNHRAALALLEKLISQDPKNPDYRLMMARSYRDLSPVLIWRGRRNDAREATAKASDILEELSKQYPSHPNYRYELMKIYSRRDWRSSGTDGHEGVEQRYQRAIEIAKKLVEDFPNVAEYSARHAYTYFKLGSLMRRSDQSDKAEAHLRRTIELLKAHAGRFGETGAYRFYLAMARNSLAESLLARDQLAEARTLLETSIADSESAATGQSKQTNQRFARFMLARQYYNLGQVLKQLGEADLAEEQLRKAKEVRGSRIK